MSTDRPEDEQPTVWLGDAEARPPGPGVPGAPERDDDADRADSAPPGPGMPAPPGDAGGDAPAAAAPSGGSPSSGGSAPEAHPPLPPPPVPPHLGGPGGPGGDDGPSGPGGPGGPGTGPPPSGDVPPPPPPGAGTPPPGGAPSAGAHLRRSADDRVLAGVCGGIGHYFGIDPVIVRIAFVVFTLAWGSGVLAYAIAWIAIPEQRPGEPVSTRAGAPDPAAASLAIGGLLVVVGVFLLADRLVPSLGRYLWPLILIGVGVAVAVGGRR